MMLSEYTPAAACASTGLAPVGLQLGHVAHHHPSMNCRDELLNKELSEWPRRHLAASALYATSAETLNLYSTSRTEEL